LESGFASVAELRQWRSDTERFKDECLATSPFNLNALAESSWAAWRERVLHFLVDPQSLATDVPLLADLILAASGRLPSRLFRADLAAMLPWEWSLLVLEATMPPSSTLVTAWGMLAGLRALGFDGVLLRTLAGPDNPEGARFAEGVPPAPKGILTIVESFDLVQAGPPPDIPTLLVHSDHLQRYDAALGRLVSLGVVSQDKARYGKSKLSGNAQGHANS
jgi:hypothetical protein